MILAPYFPQRRSCNRNIINVSKGWDKCGYIGSGFKVNVDRFRYRDLVIEGFEKIENYILKERLKNLTNKL